MTDTDRELAARIFEILVRQGKEDQKNYIAAAEGLPDLLCPEPSANMCAVLLLAGLDMAINYIDNNSGAADQYAFETLNGLRQIRNCAELAGMLDYDRSPFYTEKMRKYFN